MRHRGTLFKIILPGLVVVLLIAGVAAYMGYLLALVGGAIGFVLLLATGIWLYLRLSLPRFKGRINGPELRQALRIVRDCDYIPHIYAKDKLDAYWGLGYVHAQDRLWQMEFQRRSGQGRLAEILGRRVITIDRFTRTLGLAACARQNWGALSPDAQQRINAYVSGINAFIGDKSPARLGPEFAILRVRPEAWTNVDVLIVSKMIAWSMGGTYVTEMLRADLIEAVGPERAKEMMPDYKLRDEVSTSSLINQLGVTPGEVLAPELAPAIESSWPSPSEGIGSNMWVVSAAKSQTEAAVLANDPHLMSTLPLTWYLAHVCAPGLEVSGATIPGVPAHIIGRNLNIAWGMTNLNPDVQDLFRERLDEKQEKAEFQQEMQPLVRFTERISVKGGAAVELLVRKTRHGPLISDVIDAAGAELPVAGRAKKGEPLALQWTGLAEDDTTLQAFFKLNEATCWQEFSGALRDCVAPAANFLYADVEGNIGHHAAGRIPVRAGGDGSVPAEGWAGQAEWAGFIPFDELPQSFNPPEQYLVSTNNTPPPESYHWFLGRDWVEPYREQRIKQVLEESELLDFEAHVRLQLETISTHARETLPTLLASVRSSDAEIQQAVSLLSEWDGDAKGNCPQAAIFVAWWRRLPRVILEDELEANVLSAYEGWTSYVNGFVMNLIKGSGGTSREVEELIEKSLRLALNDIKAKLGPDMASWRWNQLHYAVFPHYPFHSVRWLRRFFSRRIPRGGDWSSVNFSPSVPAMPFMQRNVPGYRQVIDLSHMDAGWFIQAVGQSGHFLSPHYADYLADWGQGKYRKMRLSEESVNEAAIGVLDLIPPAA